MGDDRRFAAGRLFSAGRRAATRRVCRGGRVYKRAAADIEARGMTFVGDNGREYVNPSHQMLTSQASAMAQMAVKLRLCPSARTSDRVAATKTAKGGGPARPWESVG
ncbi:MAG: P27 family phage terminase small subunit [Deltaproteobacteria bacterium]|nr:P27 family phage terminase small subunit [Deltaproteobacteria bacterium]